ncbi:HNH endonuclease signature motif containing protein [Microbacterium lacus]|nr:HNH endonuclease signature motif containing protein [Microbacterium lacus]
MKPALDALRDVDAALAAALAPVFASDAVHEASDALVLEAMAVAGSILRRIEGFLVEATDVVRGRSEGPRDERMTTRAGCGSVSEVVQRTTRMSGASAGAIVRAAGVVHRERSMTSGEWLPATLPAVRDAMIAGAVGSDGVVAASVLVEASGRIDRDALLLADAALGEAALGVTRDVATGAVESGPQASAQELRVLAQVWASVLDQDGAEPVEASAMRRRGLTVGPVRDGLARVSGDVLAEVAAQWQRNCDSLSNPKVRGGVGFVADGVGVGDSGDAVGEPRDTRTHAQKMHDALATSLDVAARSGELPTVGGGAPTLVVYAREEDVVAGTGWVEVEGINEPVGIGVAERAACCGSIQRVTCNDRGRIVGLSVTDRVFNAIQRKAISLRDGGCVIPGCHVPAGWCEIHHVTDHALGGPTHTDNGVLLCWVHHRTLPTSGWSVVMIDGVPHVRGPAWWDPERRWRPAAGSRLRQRARVGAVMGHRSWAGTG